MKDIDNIADDQIILYLKGKMSLQEEEAFINELQENPDLKQRAIAISRLIKGLKKEGEIEDKKAQDAFMASSKEDVENVLRAVKLKNKLRNFSNKRIFATLSIAASLITIVWLGVGYNRYIKTTELGNVYANTLFAEGIIRGEESNEAESTLNKLFNNVRSGKDLSQTIDDLNLYWQLSNMDTYNDYTNYRAEIGWYIAIGYLKDNDKESAINHLESMLKIYPLGTAVGDKIYELLKEVKDI